VDDLMELIRLTSKDWVVQRTAPTGRKKTWLQKSTVWRAGNGRERNKPANNRICLRVAKILKRSLNLRFAKTHAKEGLRY